MSFLSTPCDANHFNHVSFLAFLPRYYLHWHLRHQNSLTRNWLEKSRDVCAPQIREEDYGLMPLEARLSPEAPGLSAWAQPPGQACMGWPPLSCSHWHRVRTNIHPEVLSGTGMDHRDTYTNNHSSALLVLYPSSRQSNLLFSSSLAMWAKKYMLTSGSPQNKGGKRLWYDLAIAKYRKTNQKTEELRSIKVIWVDKLEKKIWYYMVLWHSRSKVQCPYWDLFFCNVPRQLTLYC